MPAFQLIADEPFDPNHWPVRPLAVWAANKDSFEVCAEGHLSADGVRARLWAYLGDEMERRGWRQRAVSIIEHPTTCVGGTHCKHWIVRKAWLL